MKRKYYIMTNEEYDYLMKKDLFAMRSCWNCNTAHDHLKNANYLIFCFCCGILYYKGKEVRFKEEK